MESLRWLRLAPLAMALAAGSVATGGPVAGAAGGAAWDPPPCPATDTGGPPGASAWYRLDPVLDRSGTLAARRLTIGLAGEQARWVDLAPESFASGPMGGLVLAGEDDGVISRLRLLDPARGCATAVADEAAVIRSAIIDRDGRSIWEHRVDRATRADLGVWRRPLGGVPVLALDGLAPDATFGPTFVTDLAVAADGRVIASSCGVEACRVRVLDPVTAQVVDVRGTGPALGVSGSALVVVAACAGQPCPVEAVDLASGRRTVLAEAAWAATLDGGRDDRLVVESDGGRIEVVEIASGQHLARAAGGGVPLRRGSTATAGAETPAGTVALAPRGRPDGGSLRVFDPVRGTSAPLREIVR